MKKILFVLVLLISTVIRLQAQQILIAPSLKLNSGLQHPFKLDSLQKPQLLKPNNDLYLQRFGSVNPNDQHVIVYSMMPVEKVSSSDHMPIVKLGGNDYNMPVQKVTVINPLEPAKKELP